MANLINLEAVGKAYGPTLVLDQVSLGVADGERIGVVGRNGGGKSTLLAILAGDEPADSGRVTRTGGIEIGRLSQHDSLPPAATVIEAVIGDRVEHEWAADARVRGVLEGLLVGIAPDAVVGVLSGGERRRVALAALIVADPDVLLLDEPTNHLDIEAVDWLATHLRNRRGALVVVTHDRWFLDAVCEQTWEVADATVHRYDGGYAAYILARAERDRQAATGEDRRRQLVRKELAWLRRGPPARTSKPKFRIEAANALIADEPPPRDRVELARFATSRLGKDVYDVEDVTVALGDRMLLKDLTWRLGPGDRFGLLGANGAGKTTMLRLLLGEVRPSAGRVRTGKTVVPAYLSQQVGELDLTLRVLQSVEEIAKRVTVARGKDQTAGQLLETLGFPSDRQWTPVGDLSGGERRRVQLLRLLMAQPNVLLLDEPTNDLDVETLSQVEDLLDGWAGTVVVISHDRWFLERVCDVMWALPGDGTLRHLPGGVEDYLALRRAAHPAPASGSGSATRSMSSGGDERATRKELQRIERRLEKIGSAEKRLHDRLAEHATDHERVLALDTELRELAREKTELEDQWMDLADDG
ncbi:MAG TPA: ABC-F family ATP-binding cassette domain-containing protein [Mycobacteriales bacterium]|jgi:ATP-binding cassette subfamily F protein uup|nr:ABC-F family ATP-binding cassette domain-containing protein [Mycobacteriales bacterium]